MTLWPPRARQNWRRCNAVLQEMPRTENIIILMLTITCYARENIFVYEIWEEAQYRERFCSAANFVPARPQVEINNIRRVLLAIAFRRTIFSTTVDLHTARHGNLTEWS
jgi:hypothetical protein